ncbi:mutator type transposase [Tanacetum coccineum]
MIVMSRRWWCEAAVDGDDEHGDEDGGVDGGGGSCDGGCSDVVEMIITAAEPRWGSRSGRLVDDGDEGDAKVVVRLVDRWWCGDGDDDVGDGGGGRRRRLSGGGDGAAVEGWQRRWRRVAASGCGDRIDRVMGSIFGFGRKSPPEKFSGGGGGGGRRLAGNGERGREDGEYTTVKIDVYREEDPIKTTRIFRRIYVCLGALERVVGVDANNGIYPVAYGIVESENQYSWTWFLTCLADDLDMFSNSNFTFIIDRQKHRYCARHINKNMNLTWKGGDYKEMLWKCATSTTVVKFQKHMQELKDYNKKAFEWLNKILAKHWSRAYFSGRAHCDLLINNVCEVFNRQLLEARDSPIITALEFVERIPHEEDCDCSKSYSKM